MPADRATSDAVAPGEDAATNPSFSSRYQNRRRSTGVISSTRGFVIELLLTATRTSNLRPQLPMFALNRQGGLKLSDTLVRGIMDYSELAIDALHQTSIVDKSGIVFDEISCEGRDASDIPRRHL
jgi:hypothetical protein